MPGVPKSKSSSLSLSGSTSAFPGFFGWIRSIYPVAFVIYFITSLMRSGSFLLAFSSAYFKVWGYKSSISLNSSLLFPDSCLCSISSVEGSSSSFCLASDLSFCKALLNYSGSFHTNIMPSAEVVIRCLKLVLRQRAVVISPHVVRQIGLPDIAS